MLEAWYYIKSYLGKPFMIYYITALGSCHSICLHVRFPNNSSIIFVTYCPTQGTHLPNQGLLSD